MRRILLSIRNCVLFYLWSEDVSARQLKDLEQSSLWLPCSLTPCSQSQVFPPGTICDQPSSSTPLQDTSTGSLPASRSPLAHSAELNMEL